MVGRRWIWALIPVLLALWAGYECFPADPGSYFASRSHVWLIGSSSGIGKDLAHEIGRVSHVSNVTLTLSSRSKDKLSQIKREIEKYNPNGRIRVQVLPMDCSNVSDIRRAYFDAVQRSGDVDLLIYNAGINQENKKFLDSTSERMNNIVATNFAGPIAVFHLALRDMVARGRGHIVSISSLAAYRGVPGGSVYAATKAGLSSLTESLRVEYGGQGVLFTDVKPGFIATPALEGLSHAKPFLMSSADAATAILNAVCREREHFAFPLPMHLASLLGLLVPSGWYVRFIRLAAGG